MVLLRMDNGSVPPFGSEVLNSSGVNVGMVMDDGEAGWRALSLKCFPSLEREPAVQCGRRKQLTRRAKFCCPASHYHKLNEYIDEKLDAFSLQRTLLTAACGLLITGVAHRARAGIALDRTRLIINEKDRSASANLTNTSPDTPFLAQSWVENASGEKITSPLMVLPPLQRINGGQKSCRGDQNQWY